MSEDRQWRHKKRGTVYRILFEDASLQCAAEPGFERMFQDESWIVYQNVKTLAVWVRPYEEFMDGRFEAVEGSQP